MLASLARKMESSYNVVVQNKNNWVKGDGVFMANGNLSEEKIRIIVNTLESKKLMPSSHLYKRFPGKSIGEAAEVFATKYSDEAREKPALSLIAVVLSIHRNYTKIVEPRTDRMRKAGFGTFADLRNKAKNLDTFSEFCEMRANEKYNIVVEMLAAIDKLKENTKEMDDFEVLHKWALGADYRNYKNDIIGGIKGVGLATFQHLRMNFGANTVKPDQRVKEVLKKEFGLKLTNDIENIDAVEYIAKVTHKSALYIDQVFVNYGSGYYVNGTVNQVDNGIIMPSIEQKIVKNVVEQMAQTEYAVKDLNPQSVSQKEKHKKNATEKSESKARHLVMGDSNALNDEFNDYFSQRKISHLKKENPPKSQIGKKNAHFYKYRKGGQVDGELENFLYISPSGNICLTFNDAKKLNYAYDFSDYSHGYKAVITESRGYTNISVLLDDLVALHNNL